MPKCEILVTKDYLVLPSSDLVNAKRLKIYADGTLVDGIDARLDYINPQFDFYYPIKQFKGEKITLETSPDMIVRDIQTDTPDYSYTVDHPFRPQIHFTANHGWLNDPNGLVEYTSPVSGKKTYHMFFQYNPYDYTWGNMHWGHAISDDLMSWKELDIALYPDKTGTMFSGSAIVDRENRSGLKEGDEDTILLFYTAAGWTSSISEGVRFTQCLAYSNDGGKTFKKYDKNPLIPNIEGDNRDPKVIWCEEMNCYILALYLNRNEFVLFTSDNFLDWKQLQVIEIADDAECPDIYPMYVNGDKNNKKWVIHGASYRYLILDCDENGFKVIQDSKPLSYSRCIYATQSFSDISDGRRISVAWNNGLRFPNTPFTSQMSVPYNMSLIERDGQYYLCANPIEELAAHYEDTKVYENVAGDENKYFSLPLGDGAYDIELEFDKSKGGRAELTLFGTRIWVDINANTISASNVTIPLSLEGGKAVIRFITDKCSMEIFSAEGSAMLTNQFLCDFNVPSLSGVYVDDAIITKATLNRFKGVFK